MRQSLAAIILMWGTPALAQQAGHEGHAMPMEEAQPDPHAHHHMPMDHGDEVPHAPPPADALAGPGHAAETIFPAGEMAQARLAAQREMGSVSTHLVMFDRLEWQAKEGEDALLWDANIWFGGDMDKLWIKSEGEIEEGGAVEEAEVQALWSHAIGPWFDLQAGIRQDIRPQPERTHIVLGIQGLAPYFFEVDAAVFLSQKGDVTARIEAEYDQRITQRLIAQPRVELGLSAQDIPELAVGAGFTSVQAGLRLRYELARELAPYVGVEWQRDLGNTADFVRAAGGKADRMVFIAGVKAWF